MDIGVIEVIGIALLIMFAVWIIRGIFRIGDIITLLREIRDELRKSNENVESDREGNL